MLYLVGTVSFKIDCAILCYQHFFECYLHGVEWMIHSYQSPQPSSYTVRDNCQVAIVDMLNVSRAHIVLGRRVTHDQVRSRLIATSIGNRPERAPQIVESTFFSHPGSIGSSAILVRLVYSDNA